MAQTIVRDVASGNTSVFSVPFSLIDTAHLRVLVDGVAVPFTVLTQGSVDLGTKPPAGAIVERRRVTPSDPLVTFTSGNLDARDLNDGTRQGLYVAQEAMAQADDVVAKLDDVAGSLDAAVAQTAESAAAAGQALTAVNAAKAVAAQASVDAETSRVGAYNFLVDTQGAAGVAVQAKNDAQAAAQVFADAKLPSAPVASKFLRRNAANDAYELVDALTSSEVKAGTDAVKVVNSLRLLDRLKYDGWLSARHFGIRCDGSAEDTRIDAALANGVPIFFPPSDGGVIPLAQPLVLRKGGGLFGVGERTQFRRQFSGGPMVSFDLAGGAPGEQIRLHDFCLLRDDSQPIAAGDDGIQIGLTQTWGGRGVFRDITIVKQWHGLAWRGGTVSAFDNIRVYEGKGHGFYGINPRGSLRECHAEYNEGNGYHLYAASSGETGVVLDGCGTFASQGFGLQLDAAAGVTGANLWLRSRFSSSFDGRGGVFCDKPALQVLMRDLFVEYAGYAKQFKPAFADYPGARGLTLVGASSRRIKAGDVEIINCRGAGALIDGADVEFTGVAKIANNGTGAGNTGADRNGINIQNGARVSIQELKTEAHLASATQVYDLAVNTADCNVAVRDADARAVFDPAGKTAWTGHRPNLHDAVVASASTLVIPPSAKRISVSGAVQIDAIQATFNGHEVTLSFQSTPVLGAGNNIRQPAQRTMQANQSVRAYCNGTNWYIS